MKILRGFTLAHLSDFDEVIDVRSPSEFSADHIPGAINYPVLYDEERALVGTLYKQDSAFMAKKVGAAIVSKNISDHLAKLTGKPKSWRPLIYCWRGGKRSGAMTHIFSEIGWQAVQLEGGYKSYRKAIVEDILKLPEKLSFKVICGKTGCGKSRLLQALKSVGAQVLDLEDLAHHRGSVLGGIPDNAQPTQKSFESSLWFSLARLDPGIPVFIESESKKIGNLRVPESLIQSMWESPCLKLEADFDTRVRLLREDYRHLMEQPQVLSEKLDKLVSLYGHEKINTWKKMIGNRQWDQLIMDLITSHYDVAYAKSIETHYSRYAQSDIVRVNHARQFEELAKAIYSGMPGML